MFLQLPDSTAPSSTSTTHQSPPPPSSYLPLLIGSTAACLILQQSGLYQKSYDNANANQSFQNNQNYYQAKDSSLNMSNSSVFLNSATGVLHPSNRNNIKPSKRNLFTSTPMGGNVGGGGVLTGERSHNK